MPLDFGLLLMTELRNRTGEILDRVADRGQAFIVERNGRQKTCLVPLSVFFPDIPPTRFAEEIQELVQDGEEGRTTFTETHELAFRFPCKLTDDNPIEAIIFLPHGYPNNCPGVNASPISEGGPRRWADGTRCLYGVMTGSNPGKHTVFSTLSLARQWFQHDDTWRQTGQWPKEEGTAE
jgi:prevent-host-death family protein